MIGLIDEIAGAGNVTKQQIVEFSLATKQFTFLFQKDIHQYLEEISRKALDLRNLEKSLSKQDLPREKQLSLTKEKDKVFAWFTTQFLSNAERKFAKVLDFRKL